jgi:hypothetical protein
MSTLAWDSCYPTLHLSDFLCNGSLGNSCLTMRRDKEEFYLTSLLIELRGIDALEVMHPGSTVPTPTHADGSSKASTLAGSGKSILWFVAPQILQYWQTYDCQVVMVSQSSTKSRPSVRLDRLRWRTFILTFEMLTSKPAVAFFPLSSSNSLVVPMPFVMTTRWSFLTFCIDAAALLNPDRSASIKRTRSVSTTSDRPTMSRPRRTFSRIRSQNGYRPATLLGKPVTVCPLLESIPPSATSARV